VSSVFGNQCAQCGADIIAAEWSEHLSESCVRNVWSCEACGYQFEDTIYLPAQEAAADAAAPYIAHDRWAEWTV